MATKKPAKKVVVIKRSGANAPAASTTDKIKDVYLDDQACADYLIYGTATIEDRAIVGTYDGLKPVMRRILWAMHKGGMHSRAQTVKAAKIVGDTMGQYHPHGDKSIFDAAVNAAHLPQPYIDGSDSNWGTMTENAAAMRYINGRLTKYADATFFDPFYLPTLVYASNYDGSHKEPVNLVTLLPNGLLNGNFGICPGVNTRTPAFTLSSMVALLKAVINNKGKCTADMCKVLVWITDFGGHVKPTAANKAAMKEFFKTGMGSIEWSSSYTLDEKLNAIRYVRFAPFSTSKKAPGPGKKSPLENLMAKVEAVKGVAAIDDTSEKNDPFQQAYTVRFVKTCTGKAREDAIKKLESIFSERQRFDVKVTDRVLKEDQVDAKLRPVTVPQLIEEWLEYRIQLEKVACSYWIVELDKEIREHEVFRLAIKHLDFIIKQIKNDKLTDEQLVATISKGLKITDAETNMILARNLRQLRGLADQKLVEKIKSLQTYKAELVGRNAKPRAYVAKHLDVLLKEFDTKTTLIKKAK